MVCWSAPAGCPSRQLTSKIDRETRHTRILGQKSGATFPLVIQHVRFVVLEYLGMREGQLAARQPRPGREAGSLAGLG